MIVILESVKEKFDKNEQEKPGKNWEKVREYLNNYQYGERETYVVVGHDIYPNCFSLTWLVKREHPTSKALSASDWWVRDHPGLLGTEHVMSGGLALSGDTWGVHT